MTTNGLHSRAGGLLRALQSSTATVHADLALGKLLVIDPSLAVTRTMPLQGEGWGITSDEELWISNGTSQLMDARNEEIRRINVTLDGKRVLDSMS